jgi:hypothetical protein
MIADLIGLLAVAPFIAALWLALYYAFRWAQKHDRKEP